MKNFFEKGKTMKKYSLTAKFPSMKNFRQKGTAIKKHSLAAKFPYHVDFEENPPPKNFSYFRELFEATTLHALPDFFSTPKTFYRIVWGIVFILAILACCFHLYVMLAEIVDSPIVSKTSYEFAQEMAFPRLEICAQTGRMLRSDILEEALNNNQIQIEYIYAVEFGMGVYNHHDPAILNGWLNMTKVEEEYNRAIQNHGSVIEAWRDLYRNFGLPCERIVASCKTGTFRVSFFQ